MSIQKSIENRWVIVEVHKQEFAIPAAQVREILAMPDVTEVPCCRPQDRGVINLRGRVLRVLDLRKLLGWQSVPEELEDFYQTMSQREQDHRHWLNELERSVREGREFTLATDPHKCAFGQWYYAYQSDSPWINGLLRRFEGPHTRLHGVAESVLGFARDGKLLDAAMLIERQRKGELQKMISLFEQMKVLMRQTVREVAVVVTANENVFAVVVDGAVAVENIAPELLKDLNTAQVCAGCGMVRKAAERRAGKSLALILEPEKFGASTGVSA